MASFQSRLRGFVGNVGAGVGASKDKEKDKDKDLLGHHQGHGHGHKKEKDKRKSSLTNSSGNLKRGSSLAANDPADHPDAGSGTNDSTASSASNLATGSQHNLATTHSNTHPHTHVHSHTYATGGFMSNSGSANDLSSTSFGADTSTHSVPPRAVTPASAPDTSNPDLTGSSDPHLASSSGAETPSSETGSLDRPSSSSASASLRNPQQQNMGSNGKLTSSESNESLPDSSANGGSGKASGGKSSKSKLSKWKDKALEKSEKWMVKANELRHGHGNNTKKSAGDVAARVFNVPLQAAVAASQIDETCPLPAVVIRSIEFLEAKGMYEVGLYRIPGSSSTVGRLKHVFDSGGDLNLFLEDPPVDPHAVATLLKLFLRELPENILGSYLPHFTELLTTEARPIPLMAALARQLPLPNYYLLSWLCAHLARLAYFSDVNKMTIKNLALIFSWTLQLDSHLLTTLVDHAVELFPLTSDGLIPDEVYKGDDADGATAGEYSATYHTANTTALGVVGDDGTSTPEMSNSPAPVVTAAVPPTPAVVSPGQAQTYKAAVDALARIPSPAGSAPGSPAMAPPSLPSRPGSPLKSAVTADGDPAGAPEPHAEAHPRPASIRSMSPTRSPVVPVHSRSATAPIPAALADVSPTPSPPQLNLLGSLDIGARLSMDFADLAVDPLQLPASNSAVAPPQALHGYSSSSRDSSPTRSLQGQQAAGSPKVCRSPSPQRPPSTASPRPGSPARSPSPMAVDTSPKADKPITGDLLVFSPVAAGPDAASPKAQVPPPDPFADPSSP